MIDILGSYYLWLRAAHVIAIISWMAGLLYLPRLYVYHIEAGQTSRLAETFQVMERRLLKYIMNPAMLAAFLTGGLMIWVNPDLMSQGWVHGKLTLVLLLAATHGMMAKYRRQLAGATCTKTSRFFRVFNEIPTVLMIAIVILAIVKPF